MVYTYEVIIRHIIRQLHTHYTHTTPAISLFFFFLFFSIVSFLCKHLVFVGRILVVSMVPVVGKVSVGDMVPVIVNRMMTVLTADIKSVAGVVVD